VRAFCLAAFADLGRHGAAGEVPFVVQEHESGLLEYRPLVRSVVEARIGRLADLPDARIALDELRRERAAAIFAGGHEAGSAGDRALFEAVLIPLLVRTAEGCAGFDWEDGAFQRAYAELERTLYGSARAYTATAPLTGLSLATAVRVGRELVARPAAEAPGCELALERELPGREEKAPDAPAEIAAGVTALRIATGAPVAAGPAVVERLDRHPLGTRPLPWTAATVPGGDPGRLDPWRAALAGDLHERLARDPGSEVAEAVESWELALFEDEPLRSDRLREALAALLGGADGLWAAAMRAALLLGDGARERFALVDRLRELARGHPGGVQAADDIRRAILETLHHDDRARLVTALDEALLGLRPRPAGYFAARAASG
jgi:hypothetical protein